MTMIVHNLNHDLNLQKVFNVLKLQLILDCTVSDVIVVFCQCVFHLM